MSRLAREYIARITIYNMDGDQVATAYDSWSSNCPATETDLNRVRGFLDVGIYGELLAASARVWGCAIQIYECKEKLLWEGQNVCHTTSTEKSSRQQQARKSRSSETTSSSRGSSSRSSRKKTRSSKKSKN